VGTIGEEIRQTRPFASVAEEAVVTLVATASRVREGLSEVCGRRGITLQQYNVLRILRGAGDAGLPTLDIAARMIDRSPGITRLIDRLEGRRLVRRKRCPSDRRQVLCHSTPDAQRLLAELDAPMSEAASRCFAPLEDARTLEIVALLDQIRAACCAVPRPETLAAKTRSRH
jgi:DNA-binding MarR family transcriptional regulator